MWLELLSYESGPIHESLFAQINPVKINLVNMLNVCFFSQTADWRLLLGQVKTGPET